MKYILPDTHTYYIHILHHSENIVNLIQNTFFFFFEKPGTSRYEAELHDSIITVLLPVHSLSRKYIFNPRLVTPGGPGDPPLWI